MTYLTRRGATWHFRFRLPDDLRGKPIKKGWPKNLERLVSPKSRMLKHELTESLRTSANSIARVRAGVLISDAELLVREARHFLSEGPPRTIANDIIEFLAERRAREMLASDDALRKRGLGLDLKTVRDAGLASLRVPLEQAAPNAAARAGMTKDDLDLIKFVADKRAEEVRLAVALRRPPDWVREWAAEALEERGIELPAEASERDELDVEFLAATQRALEGIRRRNAGEFVATPAPLPDPAEQQGPTLSQTFEQWKAGTLLPGMKVPTGGSVAEAETCVRRFRELHGDPRIGAITREQARAFKDAMWALPKGLPDDIERLPLPAIIARGDISKYPRRSAGTLGKHVTLMRAILNKGANAHDLKFKGWHNPFEGLMPETGDERERDPFTQDELGTIFTSSIYDEGERPRGGQGEAAFWLPLLATMSGARLAELAQLRLRDVRRDEATGIDFFDFNDEEEGRRLKTKSSRREVPIHPAIIDAGFSAYVAWRRTQAKSDNDPLFPGLEPRGKKKHRWAGAWSKWFNRWRKERLKIVGSDTRKDFHSFRHAFKDMCRDQEVSEEVHDALTGHSFKGGRNGVGRGYGKGVPLRVRASAIRSLKPPAPILKLKWQPPTAGQD